MIYTYRLPSDYPQKLIGVYAQDTGDSPFDLIAAVSAEGWNPPEVVFDVSVSRLDPLPSTNLPVQIMKNDLAHGIAQLAGNELVLIPVPVVCAGESSGDFSIVHPTREIEIWDLEASDWKGLDTEDWPDDNPMYLYDMVLRDSIEKFSIAYNKHWSSMLVFDQRIAALIQSQKTWVTVFEPQHFSSA